MYAIILSGDSKLSLEEQVNKLINKVDNIVHISYSQVLLGNTVNRSALIIYKNDKEIYI